MGWLLLIAAASACEDLPVMCTNEARGIPPIRVTVQDSITAQPMAAGATLVLATQGIVDSASVPIDRTDLNATPMTVPRFRDLRGTYTVTVRRAGYLDWERADVVVQSRGCEVATRNLTARLVAAP